MLIAFVPASIISICFYVYSYRALVKSAGENNYMLANNIKENIENRVQQVNQFADWIYSDLEILKLLKKPANTEDTYLLRYNVTEGITNKFFNLPVSNYLNYMTISGENGINIVKGTGSYVEIKDEVIRQEWYNKGLKQGGRIVWGEVYNFQRENFGRQNIIPVMRMIKDETDKRLLGETLLLFNEKLLRDGYSSLINKDIEEVFLVDKKGNIISSSNTVLIGSNMYESPLYQYINTGAPDYFMFELDGTQKLVVYKKMEKNDWTIIKVLSLVEIENNKKIIVFTIMILIMLTIFLSWTFSLFLSGSFTRPINLLAKHVKDISCGNFGKFLIIENSNELGELAKHINKMAEDIQVLIHDSLRKEEEKRVIEIKLLQDQINPHFIYNTLNSIKWMAVMQGAEGIKNMVGALGRLFMIIVRESDEKVTISKELDIIADYMYIQRIRYKGKVNYNIQIEDEKLLDYYIIKFTLQPIIENAIFHGIESKDGSGKIVISIKEKADRLVLSVWDDGIGMSSETISKILFDDTMNDLSARGSKKIGIGNVNRRIKLTYGESYGIHIDSTEGQYTCVFIEIPIETERK